MTRKPLSVRELLCNPLPDRRVSALSFAATGNGKDAAIAVWPKKSVRKDASVLSGSLDKGSEPTAPDPNYGAVIGEVLDGSTVGLIILDADAKIVWVNRALERYFGLTKGSLIGKDYRQVIDRQYKGIVEDPLELAHRLTATPTEGGSAEPFECHVLPGGPRRERWLEHRSQAIQSGVFAGGRIEHFTDISDRKKMEEAGRWLNAQLQQAQKMEAIGILAGGVAHDFNNLLQAISGYTQLLLMNKPADHPDVEMLNAIEKASVRAGSLTQQLLAFSRRVESRLQPTNLNTLIRLVKKILDRTLPKMIHIRLALAENLSEIAADDVQIEQVLMNLALNARQAMPDGGQLTFATRNVFIDLAGCAAHPDLPTGEYVHLSVTDTGSGMDDKIQQHIFEPFYSTRGVGEGSGLGLSMVYGIVKNHGGSIECTSDEGRGTEFNMYFPVPAAETSAGAQRTDKKGELLGGDETVLIVDDDPALVTLGQQVLELYGYHALTAESGEAALAAYQAHGECIDLVVLDLNMPGMGGEKCLAEMVRLKRDIKLILTSGHPPDGNLCETIAAAGCEFIGKPYPLDALLRKVRDVLNRRVSH
ncbi:MAG: ATP-binding protein [Desulfobacterales bacterium]|jgi:PAS domain S-box-containing protein